MTVTAGTQQATSYGSLPNSQAKAANGIGYAYRDTGGDRGAPLVLLQHFRGNLDNWDPSKSSWPTSPR